MAPLPHNKFSCFINRHVKQLIEAFLKTRQLQLSMRRLNPFDGNQRFALALANTSKGILQLRLKVITNHAEPRFFGCADVFGSVGARRVRVINNKRLFRFEASAQQNLFPMPHFQHIQIEANVRVKKNDAGKMWICRRLGCR